MDASISVCTWASMALMHGSTMSSHCLGTSVGLSVPEIGKKTKNFYSVLVRCSNESSLSLRNNDSIGADSSWLVFYNVWINICQSQSYDVYTRIEYIFSIELCHVRRLCHQTHGLWGRSINYNLWEWLYISITKWEQKRVKKGRARNL